MSDASSNADQTNDEVPKYLLAKKFFDKLRKDGPMRDKVGQSFVRHFSEPAVDPLKEYRLHTDKSDSESDLSDDIEEPISPARRLRQLRAEIMNEFSKHQNSSSTDQDKPSEK